jgi:DNA-directed RNA polymerase subunit H (RpoH/RPB5)
MKRDILDVKRTQIGMMLRQGYHPNGRDDAFLMSGVVGGTSEARPPSLPEYRARFALTQEAFDEELLEQLSTWYVRPATPYPLLTYVAYGGRTKETPCATKVHEKFHEVANNPEYLGYQKSVIYISFKELSEKKRLLYRRFYYYPPERLDTPATAQVTFFHHKELYVSPLDHVFQPTMTKLSPEEKDYLLSTTPVKLSQLTAVNHNDLVSRFLALRVGDVVKIESENRHLSQIVSRTINYVVVT